MNPPLSPEEARVLGCLIEKDMATPEYYPLSLNALVNACNQKTNREPITSYSDSTVRETLDRLRSRHLCTALTGGDNRVAKYGHRASETLNLNNRELALIAALLLRGAQTLNELKVRTERLYNFDDLESAEGCLRKLAERQMVVLLPKLAGAREPRWMHLLSGEPDIAQVEAAIAAPPRADASLVDRIARLEAEVESLRAEMAAFRKQFE